MKKKVLIINKPKEHPIKWQVYSLCGCYLAGFPDEKTAERYCRMMGFEVT